MRPGVEPADRGRRPEPVLEVLVAHGEQQGGLVVLAPLVPGRDGPADQGEEGVAAAPVRRAQVALPVDQLRRGQRVEGGLEDGLALHVQGEPVLERLRAGVDRLREPDERLPHALPVLQDVLAPVRGQQAVTQVPAAGRAVLLGHRDQPFEHVRLGAVGEQRAQLVGLGHDGQRRTGPATGPTPPPPSPGR